MGHQARLPPQAILRERTFDHLPFIFCAENQHGIAGSKPFQRSLSKSFHDEVAKRRAYFAVLFGCLLMGILYFTSSGSPMAGGLLNKHNIDAPFSSEDTIGGFYVDPNHYTVGGSLAGTRMVSDFGGSITIIGTDDGTTFWTVDGRYIDGSEETDCRISIDFSVKEGPLIEAAYGDGIISWDDGNSWTKSEGANLMVMDIESELIDDGIGGFYIDPNHFDAEKGSFAGTRMISDMEGDITLIGSDDGTDFWTVTGHQDNGEIAVDFGAKGGPVIGAVYENGVLSWEDGNEWTKSALVSL